MTCFAVVDSEYNFYRFSCTRNMGTSLYYLYLNNKQWNSKNFNYYACINAIYRVEQLLNTYKYRVLRISQLNAVN